MQQYEDHINEWLEFYELAKDTLLNWRSGFWEYNHRSSRSCCDIRCTSRVIPGTGNPGLGIPPEIVTTCSCNRYVTRQSWTLGDGPEDACDRPTEVGAWGPYGFDDSSLYDISDCNPNGHLSFADAEYLKNVMLRGFVNDRLAIWGSNAVDLWHYQLPESIEKGLEPQLTEMK